MASGGGCCPSEILDDQDGEVVSELIAVEVVDRVDEEGRELGGGPVDRAASSAATRSAPNISRPRRASTSPSVKTHSEVSGRQADGGVVELGLVEQRQRGAQRADLLDLSRGAQHDRWVVPGQGEDHGRPVLRRAQLAVDERAVALEVGVAQQARVHLAHGVAGEAVGMPRGRASVYRVAALTVAASAPFPLTSPSTKAQVC